MIVIEEAVTVGCFVDRSLIALESCELLIVIAFRVGILSSLTLSDHSTVHQSRYDDYSVVHESTYLPRILPLRRNWNVAHTFKVRAQQGVF